MDPIQPIAPGTSAISRMERPPVERLEKITRERDRPSREGRGRKRQPPPPEHDEPGEKGPGPHIDVRA